MSGFRVTGPTSKFHPPPPPRRRKDSRSGRTPIKWFLLAALLIAFTYVYVGGNYGFYNMWGLKQRKTVLEREVSRLEARRLDLSNELEMLEKDPEKDPKLRLKIERKAREEYGMVRDGEMVFRFKDDDKKEEETVSGQ